jgi:transposase
LNADQLEEIGQVLRKTPREVGLTGTLWDGKTLSAYIRMRYEIDLGVRQCQRLFSQFGFRRRKPRPIVAQADPGIQEAHKKNSRR